MDTLIPDTMSAVSTKPLKQNDSNSITSDLVSQPLVQRDRRTYTSSFISYIALETNKQSDLYQTIDAQTACEAFQRLETSLSVTNPEERNLQVTVALYEFLTFTEAYGWQPLFFDVTEMLVPMLQKHGLEVVRQFLQGSESRYLAYRTSLC
ncbi:hypothetical protein [Phormidesmis priestleyi]